MRKLSLLETQPELSLGLCPHLSHLTIFLPLANSLLGALDFSLMNLPNILLGVILYLSHTLCLPKHYRHPMVRNLLSGSASTTTLLGGCILSGHLTGWGCNRIHY
jgi:hypothetical protein